MIVKKVKQYYYRLMARYLAVKIRPQDLTVQLNPQNDYLSHYLKPLQTISVTLATGVTFVYDVFWNMCLLMLSRP